MKKDNTHKIAWEKFCSFTKKEKLLRAGDKVLVAFSSGPDSTCLLYMLSRLGKNLKFGLAACYIDHGLRPAEVKKEILFAQSETRKLGIPLFIKKIKITNKKSGLEANARKARYMKLISIALKHGFNKIATGHTMDDQAETVLLNIARSKCEEGIQGIPLIRIELGVSIIRPLLCLERYQILEYLASIHCGYCTDSSNLKPVFKRNIVRMQVMPLLKALNPCIAENLSNLSSSAKQIDTYLQEEANKCIFKIAKFSENAVRLDLFEFMKYNSSLKWKILKLILLKFFPRDFYSVLINNILALLESDKKLLVSGNLIIKKAAKYLLVKRIKHEK